MGLKETLANTILQGNFEGERSRGRSGRQWSDDVKEWTGLSWNDMWREPRTVWPGETVSVVLLQQIE